MQGIAPETYTRRKTLFHWEGALLCDSYYQKQTSKQLKRKIKAYGIR